MSNSDKSQYNIATIGYFKSLNNSQKTGISKYKVFVIENDSDEPHIHLCDDLTNGKVFHICICLTKIAYHFDYGYNDTLTPEQKKDLMRFLKSDCIKNRRYKTNWEYALSMWNDNNIDGKKVDENSEVLNYTLLD